MSQEVIITSVTANTPVDIYYCDAMSGNCVYVSTVSVFPFTFNVPSPYDEENIVLKIVDTQGCIDGEVIQITPTPTPMVSPSFTPTQTYTPTNSPTPTETPVNTITPTQTITITPTTTPTMTTTPVISLHAVAKDYSSTATNACSVPMSIVNYYTYISEANLVPVIGAVVYTTAVNGVLYNPYNGLNKFRKMIFGGTEYAVQINSQGQIVSFVSCY